MLEDSFEVSLLAICWFMGMGCSIALYVKVFEYGYKAIAKSKKKCLFFAILEVVFGSYINVIANQISVKFGNYSDYVTVFFALIAIGFYCFVLYRTLDFAFDGTRFEPKYSIAIKALFFWIFVGTLRMGCMKIITMIVEQKGNVTNFWFVENVVWCWLIERMILIVENKIHTLNTEKVFVYEEIKGVAKKSIEEDDD